MVMCLGLLDVPSDDMLTSRIMTPHCCRYESMMDGIACALYPLALMGVICHDLPQHVKEGAP